MFYLLMVLFGAAFGQDRTLEDQIGMSVCREPRHEIYARNPDGFAIRCGKNDDGYWGLLRFVQKGGYWEVLVTQVTHDSQGQALVKVVGNFISAERDIARYRKSLEHVPQSGGRPPSLEWIIAREMCGDRSFEVFAGSPQGFSYHCAKHGDSRISGMVIYRGGHSGNSTVEILTTYPPARTDRKGITVLKPDNPRWLKLSAEALKRRSELAPKE